MGAFVTEATQESVICSNYKDGPSSLVGNFYTGSTYLCVSMECRFVIFRV